MRKVLNTVPYFNIVAQTTENTVVTEYEPVKNRPDFYQSEAELEREFIILLAEQGYKYLQIHNEKDLIANLRHQLEELNNYSFSDNEWKKFFATAIANTNEGIAEKSRKIQEDFVQVLRRDDGSSKNITLLDKKNIHNKVRPQAMDIAVLGAERVDFTILPPPMDFRSIFVISLIFSYFGFWFL